MTGRFKWVRGGHFDSVTQADEAVLGDMLWIKVSNDWETFDNGKHAEYMTGRVIFLLQ